MTDDAGFQFVELPDLWKDSAVIEQLYPGTRWYVERGSVQQFRHWLRELHQAHGGNLIPFSWVPDFVGVSRSAVHQRARAGGLTVFSFIVTQYSHTFLGGARQRDTRQRYDYATISECRGWSELLMRWAEEQDRKRQEDGEA